MKTTVKIELEIECKGRSLVETQDDVIRYFQIKDDQMSDGVGTHLNCTQLVSMKVLSSSVDFSKDE